MKLSLVILSNEIENDHKSWIRACEEMKHRVDYRIVNLTRPDWMHEITCGPAEVLLAKPGGLTTHYKQLYDERIYILSHVLGYEIFPSPEEIFIYENKRLLSDWLEANSVPHPKTRVFYNIGQALDYVAGTEFPIVAKTNIGASGSGVRILKTRNEAIHYVKKSFKGKGAPQRSGPNLDQGGYMKRGFHYFTHPADIGSKIRIYRTRAASLQRGFVILQEYVEHSFEWRAVRIGNSFFAHKKLKSGDMASGTLLKNYDNPPLEVLDFIRILTDKHGFYSQAVDLFDTGKGFLVNEMQCIFGQSDDFQMKVNGSKGRYIWSENEWVFEDGDFARNECYNLRLEYLIAKHEGTFHL